MPAPALFGVPSPVVVGHRGSPATHPENTPASFAAAAAAGARWVELDVRITADGEVVVHHDPTLPDGRALVDLDVVACRAAGVWTLASVLAEMPAGVGVDIEVKNFPGEPDHDESMVIVERCGRILSGQEQPGATGPRPLLLSSFNPMVLLAASELGMPHPLGLVTMTADLGGAIEVAAEIGCAAVCPHHDTEGLDAHGVRSAHGAGLAVMAWTVDDVDRAERLSSAGVDALCTNDPAALVAALSSRRSA